MKNNYITYKSKGAKPQPERIGTHAKDNAVRQIYNKRVRELNYNNVSVCEIINNSGYIISYHNLLTILSRGTMNANHIKQLSKAIDVDENTLMEACFKTYHNWKNKIDSVDEFIEEF
jgi:hypothetical protein